MTKRYGRYALFPISVLSAFACLTISSTLTLAEDVAKPAPERWRPKDGMYGFDAGGAFTVPCENFPLHYIELRKRSIAADEMYVCKVTQMTDAAPGVLRLKANCDGASAGKLKSIITLRKIDDKSFFMSWGSDQGSRFTYCQAIDENGTTNGASQKSATNPTHEQTNQPAKPATWRLREGIYARPGNDFNERCATAADVAISRNTILFSAGTSRCDVPYITADSTEDSVGLVAICDQKPGATGVVLRNGNFVAPGTETVIVKKNGDQAITLQRSRNGEFSEPAQELRYCSEAAPRAHEDSKK